VSYASQDAGVANSIVESLESRGAKCWMAPRDVKPGAEYADAIVHAITDAKALVLVMSGSAVASAHVGREVERAASKRKRIIAFKIDAAPLSAALEYFLSQSQWIDVPALGMKAALAKLAEAVGQGSVSSARAIPVASNGGGMTRRVGITAAVVVALALVAGSVLYFWRSSHRGGHAPSAPAIADRSIAVLPFVDMSEKKDQEYFADGMAEEIIDLLVKIPGLKVIGRTSSFQFKGQSQDLRNIGEKLGAAYVLEGSVRKSGDRVRVTAQLIGTRDGVHLWSETYDRQVDDVFKLQDAIAVAVARELQLSVTPDYLQSRSTVKSAEAYDLLLRGRHAGDRLDKEGLDEAASLFLQALDRDPAFVDAAASLAWTYDAQGEWGVRPPAEAFEEARRAAAVALKLDPKNSLAHYVLARIHIVYDWDWPAAQHEFEQVSALAPGRGPARDSEALLSLALGHWDEGLRQLNTALAQDPLDPPSLFILAETQMRRGQFPEAEAAIRRALDIRATQAWAQYQLGLVLLSLGDRDGALRAMQKEPLDFGREGGLAIVYYALNKVTESDAALARMLKNQMDGNAMGIAEVYAFRGQRDEAMHWLERAYAQKDVGLYAIKGDPPLKTLEGDPGYKTFLKKMNLSE
jgi:TolB-like protein